MAIHYPFIVHSPCPKVLRSNSKLNMTIYRLYYSRENEWKERVYLGMAMQRKPAGNARSRKSMEISQTVSFAKFIYNTTEILVSTLVYDMFARE